MTLPPADPTGLKEKQQVTTPVSYSSFLLLVEELSSSASSHSPASSVAFLHQHLSSTSSSSHPSFGFDDDALPCDWCLAATHPILTSSPSSSLLVAREVSTLQLEWARRLANT